MSYCVVLCCLVSYHNECKSWSWSWSWWRDVAWHDVAHHCSAVENILWPTCVRGDKYALMYCIISLLFSPTWFRSWLSTRIVQIKLSKLQKWVFFRQISFKKSNNLVLSCDPSNIYVLIPTIKYSIEHFQSAGRTTFGHFIPIQIVIDNNFLYCRCVKFS